MAGLSQASDIAFVPFLYFFSLLDRNYMHSQTRKLLRLISDDLTDAIFGELQQGPRTAKDLVDHIDAGEKTIYRRLDQLVEDELLATELSPPTAGRAGRRARKYRIAEPGLLRFRNAADAFTLEHLDRLKSSVEEHVQGERENHIRATEAESA